MRKQKNNVIRKKDFECYEIIVPFSSLMRRRKKNFLSSELEKRHPCFSDEFAFDSNIKKIGRKGICSEVFVINKFTLAEYERKRKVSGIGFLIETEKPARTAFFAHRYFVAPKYKLSVITICGVLFVIFAGFFCGKSFKVCYNCAPLNTDYLIDNPKKSKSMASEGLKSDNFENSDYSKIPDFTEIFNSVTEAKGKFLSFDFMTVGLTQKFSASVKGVFPESLKGVCAFDHGENVVYDNGIPVMTVSYSWRTTPAMEPAAGYDTGRLIMANSDFNKALRNELLACGAILKEENAPPYHIGFVCKSESGILFEKLAEIISSDGRTVTSIKINQTSNNQLQIGITIEALEIAGFDLSLLSANLDLFCDKSIYKSESKTALSTTSDGTFINLINSELSQADKKIGVIKRSDKSSVIFYKNADGKMKTLIEKKED